MIKKLLGVGVILCGMSAVSLATYSSSESQWTTVSWNANFTAKYVDGAVKMQWNVFKNPTTKAFNYYKIIRSQTKSSPVYPDDGYIKYDGNINFSSYTDTDPLAGKTYYRICAILEGQKRYCSNVQYVIVDKDDDSNYEEKKEEVKETKKVETKASRTPAIDKLASEFLAQLNAKYGSDDTNKQKILNSVISSLDGLAKKKPSIKAMILYLKGKLQTEVDELAEIKALLKVE